MDKSRTLERIEELGLVAVIRGPSPELTVQMVAALVEGGVQGIEITYSTPKAAEVVRNLDRQYGERIVLGMGTLTDPIQVAEAREAGARFLVSPICDPNLGKAMVGSKLPVMIGALTPSEVFQAFRLGSDVVKIFPGSLGGPAYLKALKGPFPLIPMMPTGGVSASNGRRVCGRGGQRAVSSGPGKRGPLRGDHPEGGRICPGGQQSKGEAQILIQSGGIIASAGRLSKKSQAGRNPHHFLCLESP